MKKMYLLLLPLVLSSCEKSKDCCAVVDTGIEIKYIDENEESWLNQQGLNENNINVYFMKEGQKEKIFRGSLDEPKMFSIRKNDLGEDVLRLFPSDYIENNKSRTLIEFSSIDVDTVDCLFNTSSSNMIIEEVWYNGEPVWNASQNTSRAVEIVKE